MPKRNLAKESVEEHRDSLVDGATRRSFYEDNRRDTTRGTSGNEFPVLKTGQYETLERIDCVVCGAPFWRKPGSITVSCENTIFHELFKLDSIKREIKRIAWKKYRVRITKFKKF